MKASDSLGLPVDVELDRKVIADVERLASAELEFLSEVHGRVAVGNDCPNEVVPVDENTVIRAHLSRVRLDLVVNHPREVSKVDCSVTREKRSCAFGALDKLTGENPDASTKCTNNRHSDRQR